MTKEDQGNDKTMLELFQSRLDFLFSGWTQTEPWSDTCINFHVLHYLYSLYYMYSLYYLYYLYFLYDLYHLRYLRYLHYT